MTIGPEPRIRMVSMSVLRGKLVGPFVQAALHRRRVQLARFGRRDQPHLQSEPVHAFEACDEVARLLILARGLAAFLFASARSFCFIASTRSNSSSSSVRAFFAAVALEPVRFGIEPVGSTSASVRSFCTATRSLGCAFARVVVARAFGAVFAFVFFGGIRIAPSRSRTRRTSTARRAGRATLRG